MAIDLKQLMASKQSDEPMDEMHRDAKMSMLKALREEMMNMMKDKMMSDHEGMKKVEVAAPDQEGLSEGLDKAKELMGASDDDSSDDQDSTSDDSDAQSGSDASDMDAEMAGSDDDKMPDDSMVSEMLGQEDAGSDLSPEKIDQLIELLQKKKMQRS